MGDASAPMRMRQPDPIVVHFEQAGEFEAMRAAELFLAGLGFSVGRAQAHSPRGILFGDFNIQKWRNLHPRDRASLHGEMIGGRAGPVTIIIHARAPAEAREAISLANPPTRSTATPEAER